jgi:hypothetical protein
MPQKMTAEVSMRTAVVLILRGILIACLFAGFLSTPLCAQSGPEDQTQGVPQVTEPPEAQVPTAAPTVPPTKPGAQSAHKPVVFRIKYVSDNTVYIDGGLNADIQEGMKLSVIEPPPDNVAHDGVRFRGYPHVAELNVVSVADSSAVCDVISATGELRVAQVAFLTPGSVEDRHLAENAKETDNYPILIAFTSDDPIDQELHSTKVEQIHEPQVGVLRGRFGFSYGSINESGMNSTQMGMIIQADMNHIGGTWWNFGGYWRGYTNTSHTSIPGTGTQTLTDLMNRTYTLGLTYNNPYSPSILGFGRLYIPWAPSLSTIDGGYYGRRIGRIVTVGAFAGSTPNPTSWTYDPNGKIAGTFVNFESGDYDHLHLMSTEGVAVQSIQWRASRQYLFLENNFNWKRYVYIYNSTQVDEARTSPYPNGGSNPTGVSQSYSNIHFQPIRLIGFGVNYNYFRSLPTFDPNLIGTGLLDKYLFQGYSGDVRLDLPRHISLYASLGRSKASSDTQKSLNQAFGITLANFAHTGVFLDAHYSKFDSDFGSGKYASMSLSKNITEKLHVQLMGGEQTFQSSFTNNTNSKFVNGTADWTIGRRYFVEGIFGWYNGTTLNYRQWSGVFGYRFGGFHR